MYSFTPDGLEHIENAVDCISELVYHWKVIDEKIWSLFSKLLSLIVGEEDDEGGILFDYFDIVQAFIFNCIKYGKDEFIKNHFEELMRSVPWIIEISKGIDDDLKEAIVCLKILQVVLENCIGSIDGVIGDIIELLN